MFAGDEEDSMAFKAPVLPGGTSAPQRSKPVVSNALFGGNDLIEEPESKGNAKDKLNGIFDYDESDDDEKKNSQQMNYN